MAPAPPGPGRASHFTYSLEILALIFSGILTKLFTHVGGRNVLESTREADVEFAVTGCVARVFAGGNGFDAGIRARRAISGTLGR